MVDKLEFCGLKQRKLDPCLFIGYTVIVVMYVEDIFVWSTEDKNMIGLTKLLNIQGVDLEEENDAARFLGLPLTKTVVGYIMMTQEGLLDPIIESMCLDVDHSTTNSTPCMKFTLTKYLYGDTCYESFACASIVGMMMYLAGHSCPEISYSVSQVARLKF